MIDAKVLGGLAVEAHTIEAGYDLFYCLVLDACCCCAKRLLIPCTGCMEPYVDGVTDIPSPPGGVLARLTERVPAMLTGWVTVEFF